MVDYLQAFVLGIIQGLTEFLPISSSAHLRILPEMFGWGDPGAAFTAVIQIGTELAVLLYFRKDIWRIASMWVRSLFRAEYRGHLDARMGWFIIIGSLPIVVLGIALKDVIEEDFRSLWIIGTTLVVLGIVLGIADRVGGTEKTLKQLTLRDAILMGLAQALRADPRRLPLRRDALDGPLPRLRARDRDPLRVPARDPRGDRRRALRAQGDPERRQPLRLGPDHRWRRWCRSSIGYAAIAWLLRYVSTHSFTPFVDLPGRARHADPDPGRDRRARRLSRYSQPDFLNNVQSPPATPAISSSANG